MVKMLGPIELTNKIEHPHPKDAILPALSVSDLQKQLQKSPINLSDPFAIIMTKVLKGVSNSQITTDITSLACKDRVSDCIDDPFELQSLQDIERKLSNLLSSHDIEQAVKSASHSQPCEVVVKTLP
jgi:hypothetical protein